MSSDICDWLAQEEANAEQWSDYDMGGARFYREQFAAARDEIVRLRAAGDALATNYELMLEQDWSSFLEAFLYEWKEARRG